MKKIPRTAKICNFYPLVTRRASPSFSYDSPVRNIREFPREVISEAIIVGRIYAEFVSNCALLG